MKDREIERTRLLLERLAERLSRHVVGIFREGPHGRPESHGSGLLVSSSTRLFLISAAHVLDPLQSGTKLFFYAAPRVTRALAGSVRVTNPPPGKDRKTDRYDVGVLRLLEPPSPPKLAVNKTGLPLSALTPRALPRRGKQYLVTGFPASKSKFHPFAKRSTPGSTAIGARPLPNRPTQKWLSHSKTISLCRLVARRSSERDWLFR
jgi:hypothetical protein